VPIDPGTQVGRFRIVRLLAQGGMAEVYRAEQELASGIFRPAALKVIRPEYAASEDFREMFLDEARTACTLSHANIVHIYEVGEVDGLLYMGMELVAGESLANVGRALTERGQRFSDEALISIGTYTCSALEAVHALKLPGEQAINLVHRDVSPHNLLLNSIGTLKLIDFGIAKAATNRNLTNPGTTKGKAGYFSPEQAVGMPLDGRSDLFSLGVTLYKLASGVTPFDEHATHHARHSALVAGQWKPLAEVAPGRQPGFYTIVGKALQVRREARYQTAEEMREELEALAYDAGLPIGQSALAGYVAEKDGEVSIPNAPRHSGSHPIRRRTADLMPAAPPPRRRGLVAAIAVAAVALAGVAIAVATRRPAPVIQQTIQVAPPVTAAPSPHPPAPAPAPATTVAARPPAERTEPRRTRPAPPRPAPEPEPEVPAGEGKLRVGASPTGVVTLKGKSWGETPVDIPNLRSGPYTVEIASADGSKRGRCSVKVLPDKTVLLKYDFGSDRCVVDYK
jgi:hypothetical protein